MNVEIVRYNLPGFGMLEVSLYPYTQVLYDFLKPHEYEKKFHETNQLGSLRDVFPGSHHTRYEYIFLQWSLICALQRQKGLGLSSKNRKEFGKFPSFAENPSGAEILQCLVLLCNMGHFPETFASSRALQNLLHERSDLRKGFREGLGEPEIFKEMYNSNDIYNIHLIVALYLLKRYKRYGGTDDYVSFPQSLLKGYIQQKDSDAPSLKRLFELYKSIRTLSFLILDSLYSPVPFSLDISSILLDFENVFEDILIRTSQLRVALKNLETVLQDTVYLNPNALLATQRVSEGLLEKFNKANRSWWKISVVRDLFEPKSNDYEVTSIFNGGRSHYTPPDWDLERVLQVDFSVNAKNRSEFPLDLVSWESSIRNTIGKTACRVGAQFDPSYSLFRIAFGLNGKVSNQVSVTKSLSIINQISKFPPLFNIEQSSNFANKERMFRFVLKSVFGSKCIFKLDWVADPTELGPFFFLKGTVLAVQHVSRYITSARNNISADRLHEMELTKKVIQLIGHRGPILAYVGSTELKYNPKNSNNDAEFDGIVVFPQKDPKEFFMVVVEAKNQRNGHTYARKQLSKRMNELQNRHSFLKTSIVEIAHEGAYAKITL